jgi:SAM-dependent methyltransferase
MSDYVLRGGQAWALRLHLLAGVFWPSTEALLRRVGLREGMRCLDAGCGVGAVTLNLAALAGSKGEAVGIDIDEQALDLARQEARKRLLNAVFRPGNVADLAEASAYDLVYARFLLSHLPAPALALDHLIRAARPGGAVVAEDTDFDGHFCHPPCPAFERYVSLYREVVRGRGADPCIGPRLPGLFLDAGLQEVRLEVVQPAFLEGEGKRLAAVTLEHVRESVTAAGLASPAELDATLAELNAYAGDPRTVMSLPRVFQVWGRA